MNTWKKMSGFVKAMLVLGVVFLLLGGPSFSLVVTFFFGVAVGAYVKGSLASD